MRAGAVAVLAGLVNLAIALYYSTFGGFLGECFSLPAALWVLFIVDTAALIVWEALSRRGVTWLEVPWALRALAVASGTAI